MQNYIAPAPHYLPSAYEQGLFLAPQLSTPILGGGVDSIEVDSFGQPVWLLPPETRDTTNSILSYYEGEYIINTLQASPTFGTPVYRTDYVTVVGNDDPPYNKEYTVCVKKENK